LVNFTHFRKQQLNYITKKLQYITMCASQSSLSLDKQKNFSNMLSFLDALVRLDLQMKYLKGQF
jgi:hypothetical protein